MDDNKIYCIWLIRQLGVGNNKTWKLLDEFKTAQKIYDASAKELKAVNVLSKPELLRLTDKDLRYAEKVCSVCKEKGFNILTCEMPSYPEKLRNIYCPPCVLYILGRSLDVDTTLTISVVGTRSCSAYGRDVAFNISQDLVKYGITVVSGMAKGIDAAANYGAVCAGGPTIAVLGSGLDVPYPRENTSLMGMIAKNGAVISEYPPGTEPAGPHFPIRNRIISGLSSGVLVVEAAKRSGALITARCANEQGRDVFAVPGNINSPSFLGTNALIKDGAKLVTSAIDIVEEYMGLYNIVPTEYLTKKLPNKNTVTPMRVAQYDTAYNTKPKPNPAPSPHPPCNDIPKEYMPILSLLTQEGKHIDDIAKSCSIPIGKLYSMLSAMELEGLIRQLPGKRFALEPNLPV